MKKNILFLLWIVGSGFGFYSLYQYSFTAGRSANLSQSKKMPDFRPPYALGTEKLLVFVHPQCPCSRATLSELENLVTYVNPHTQIRVFFFKPKKRNLEWVKAELWNQAKGISGINLEIDEDGIQAQRYGALTSGQTLLYTNKGQLIFSGGITISRGHVGENPGAEAIKLYFRSPYQTLIQTPLFGCSIRKPERAIAREKS